MLSRVADNLYWMSRYVERAEGVTRLVEVNRDTDLEFHANENRRDYWQSALSAMCAVDDFSSDEINDHELFILFSKELVEFRFNLYQYGSGKCQNEYVINCPKKSGWN